MARTNLRLAEMLRSSGNLAKALRTARRAASLDPKLVPAHLLVGSILAEQGDCAGAVAVFRTVLALEKGNAAAKQGLKGCGAPARP